MVARLGGLAVLAVFHRGASCASVADASGDSLGGLRVDRTELRNAVGSAVGQVRQQLSLAMGALDNLEVLATWEAQSGICGSQAHTIPSGEFGQARKRTPQQLRFWGLDVHPAMGRIANLLVEVVGVPKDSVSFYDMSSYCSLGRPFPGVQCGPPSSLRSIFEDSSVSGVENSSARNNWDMPGLWSDHSRPAWQRLLRALQADNEFMRADVILCSIVQVGCRIFAGSGKALFFLGTGLSFDHRVEADCGWTHTYRDLLTCSVDNAAKSCAVPWVARRSIVMTSSHVQKEYVRHVTGESISVLVNGIPSLPWRAVGQQAASMDLSKRRSEVLLLPDRARSQRESRPEFIVARDLKGWVAGISSSQGLTGTNFATARELYGRTYDAEQIIQHRAAVVIPYGSHSLSMLDWYWAGVPLFFPSKGVLLNFYPSINCSLFDEGETCPKYDTRRTTPFWMPPDLLYVFLPNGVPCYARDAALAPFQAEMEDMVRLNVSARKNWCSTWPREAPPICFFYEPEVRRRWLDKAWYYKAPHVYYWNDPGDLAFKLSKWTWEKTAEHRAKLERHLEDTLDSVRQQLLWRLEIVAEEASL